MEKQIHVGTQVIVKNEKGEILLCKRCKEIGFGEWELPGGHLEFQETFKENIEKECIEEVGIKIVPGNLISVATNMVQGNHYIVFGFVADSYTGVPFRKAPEEHSEIGWFSMDNLPEKLFDCGKNALRDYASGVIFSEFSSDSQE